MTHYQDGTGLYLARGGRWSLSSRSVVLVVEDEWQVRDIFVSHLRKTGWSVVEADNSEHAIAMLDAGEPIDIVGTDIQLIGELTGWDVAEAFRAAQPAMPVIYVSGNAPQPSRLVPESVFFPKPYDPAAILQCFR